MAEVINLNKARKRKARQDAATQAAQNRVRFGRSKQQKQRDAAVTEEARQRLDALRRGDGEIYGSVGADDGSLPPDEDSAAP